MEKGMATHSSILAWRIPMDRGAWRATVHGVAKSWTRQWLSTAQVRKFLELNMGTHLVACNSVQRTCNCTSWPNTNTLPTGQLPTIPLLQLPLDELKPSRADCAGVTESAAGASAQAQVIRSRWLAVRVLHCQAPFQAFYFVDSLCQRIRRPAKDTLTRLGLHAAGGVWTWGQILASWTPKIILNEDVPSFLPSNSLIVK